MNQLVQSPVSPSPVRVAICQMALPAYRLPVFQRLGEQDGVDLTVFSDSGRGSLPSVPACGAFRHVLAKVYHWKLLGREFHFQPAHFQVADTGKFDLLILSWDIHYLSLVPTILLAKLRGVPVVLWGHGYSQNPQALTEALRNWVGKLADGVLLYNRTTARRLLSLGFRESRVFVAQNAIDQSPIDRARSAWMADPERLAEFRKLHGLDPAETVIYVSRLEPSNRVELLIEALQRVRQSRPETRLVIVGDGPERAGLADHARQLCQQDRIIFTGAIYDNEQLAPWMLSATLFAYPVNIGLSLLHAFGYGLPVVTSNNLARQNPEIEAFIDGETGLFYRDGDVADMTAQWLRILSDPPLRERQSEQALRQVREHYTLHHMLDGFLAAIGKFTPPDRRKPPASPLPE